MKKKIFSVNMALPMLLIGSGLSFVSPKVINQENLQVARPNIKTNWVTLGTQQLPPFYLASREKKEPECRWLGIPCQPEQPQ
ncbi:MAG: hypothetical protein LDL41_12740 [Coleofasciculus sp. S288]|nr:hypothetical protein [Coleofasciculus sp. S288]